MLASVTSDRRILERPSPTISALAVHLLHDEKEEFYMKRLAVRVLSIALFGLVCLTGCFAIETFPAFAATQDKSAVQEEVIGPDSQTYKNREDAYESALEAVNDPDGLEKEYQKDLKIFKQENPDKANLVEEAKEAVENVIGK
jgi:hypothetical protein